MATADISIVRGDTVPLELTVQDDAEPPVAVDLTGATVFFTVKPEADNDSTDSSAVIKVDVTSHTSPAAGKTAILVPASASNALDPEQTYAYDIQVKFPNGEIFTVLIGKLKVAADITRRTT